MLQQIVNARDRRLRTGQVKNGFALQVEDVGFAELFTGLSVAAAEDARELGADHMVVGAGDALLVEAL